MNTLTLAQATQLIAAALTKAGDLKLKPMTVAVLDAGGHVIALHRQDGSSIMRPQIATAKAWGSLAMGIGSRSLGERAASHPAFVAALGDISVGKIAPVPGGVLILSEADVVLGAIGISGDLSDSDEACALAAIESMHLKARV